MNYGECYRWGRDTLAAAGIEEAALDARLLLEYICDTTRNDLLVHEDRLVRPGQEADYRDFIGKRAAHVPLQQLTGVQEFMGLEFAVSEHVLIPRQDTEILVEEVLRDLTDGSRILDVCTGSGCILLSLLHYSNDCVGTGTDLSEQALGVARQNADRLGLNAAFVQGDLFEHVEGTYDYIVSNPPYINSDVIPTLMEEVREHEPRMALDGGPDGLLFYRRIVEESPRYLVRGGSLYFEIGYDQGAAVADLMREAGYREIRIVKDYGGNDRVVTGVYIPART